MDTFGRLSEKTRIASLRKRVSMGRGRIHPLVLGPGTLIGQVLVNPNHPGPPSADLDYVPSQLVWLPGIQSISYKDRQSMPSQQPPILQRDARPSSLHSHTI
jgi:hypothetical protein